METVTVKTKYPHYDGFIRGFKFEAGQAEVPVEDAKAMKEFGVEIVATEDAKAPEDDKEDEIPVAKAPVKPSKSKAKVGE